MPAPVGFSVDQVSSRYRERPLAARTARFSRQQVQVGMPRTGANCDENRHARHQRHTPTVAAASDCAGVGSSAVMHPVQT